jgi:hypothetical protein
VAAAGSVMPAALDKLERLNDAVQGWALRETPALGEA